MAGRRPDGRRCATRSTATSRTGWRSARRSAPTTRGRGGVEATMALVSSTTKGTTATAANVLADEGLLDVEAPVASYWPEFGAAGKESIPVSDLLSHRAGLAWIDGVMETQDALSWDPVVRALEA